MAKRWGLSAQTTQTAKNVQKRLNRLLRKLKTAPTSILSHEAVVLKAAILNEIPYDTGELSKSVKVEAMVNKRGLYTLKATAAAYNPLNNYNYAGIQHENLAYRHTKGRKAHYISDPMLRSIESIKTEFKKRGLL